MRLVFFIGLVSTMQAQDVHFSHRDAYLFQRNSSLAALYDGEIQFASVYRRQWASISVPYTTGLLHVNKKIFLPDPKLVLNGGLLYIQDKSGDSELSINKYMLQFGGVYRYLLHEFSAGIQLAYVNKQFSDADLTFPSQYDRETGGFNGQLPNGESFQQADLSYLDVNLSLGWQYKLNDKWQPGAGLSLRHLNRPQESFFDEDNQLPLGWGLQLFATYSLSKQDDLKPIIFDYRTTKASETLIGVEWIHQIKGYQSPLDFFYVGTYSRQGLSSNIDAMIWNAGVGFKGFKMGASYDLNISDLELATNYRGGFEIQLIYTGKTTSLKNITAPCDRY